MSPYLEAAQRNVQVAAGYMASCNYLEAARHLAIALNNVRKAADDDAPADVGRAIDALPKYATQDD